MSILLVVTGVQTHFKYVRNHVNSIKKINEQGEEAEEKKIDQSESLNVCVCLIVISHSRADLISTSSSAYSAHQPVCQADKK